MLLSMTGYGDSRIADEQKLVTVEVRTVNNRYLKFSLRCPDFCAPLESRIEKVIRKAITRGTVNLALKIETIKSAKSVSFNKELLKDYWSELMDLASELKTEPPQLESLLSLPGLVEEKNYFNSDIEQIWQLIQQPLTEALEKLKTFRVEEGQIMRDDLQKQCSLVEAELSEIEKQAPEVVSSYRDRILDRVSLLLQETDASVDANDLIREVSIFADKCDINEEVTRLRCHIAQMREFMGHKNSQGRKLEFLCQEMLREVNTIGSKANQVKIAHGVIEMKGAVEKMREIVQNIE